MSDCREKEGDPTVERLLTVNAGLDKVLAETRIQRDALADVLNELLNLAGPEQGLCRDGTCPRCRGQALLQQMGHGEWRR